MEDTKRAAILFMILIGLFPGTLIGAGLWTDPPPTRTTESVATRDTDSTEVIEGETMYTSNTPASEPGYDVAYLGGGCFWCIEAVYERIEGIHSAVSGYAGGEKENPTYYDVSYGNTGHAEVVRIEYDPEVITFKEILDLFWRAHDPTTLNRQGADVGTQYRSIILYTDEKQAEIAGESISRLETSGQYADPIVTEIVPLVKFYTAEEYHQDYFENNPTAGYCRVVIAPKLKKLGLD